MSSWRGMFLCSALLLKQKITMKETDELQLLFDRLWPIHSL